MMGLPDDSFDLLKTRVDEPDNASFESALNNESISSYIDAYAKFRHDARTGHHGKTAQLWVSYMDHIWLVLQLTKAVKTNNFLLYARCPFLMRDLFSVLEGKIMLKLKDLTGQIKIAPCPTMFLRK
jgi:alpha-beta hydrolase superfamily lysophospholipase